MTNRMKPLRVAVVLFVIATVRVLLAPTVTSPKERSRGAMMNRVFGDVVVVVAGSTPSPASDTVSRAAPIENRASPVAGPALTGLKKRSTKHDLFRLKPAVHPLYARPNDGGPLN